MAESVSHLRYAKHSILVFGPQALSLPGEKLEHIRATLSIHPRYQWIRQVLDDLPRLWYMIVLAIPGIDASSGKANIQTLVDLLTKPQQKNSWSKLPNSILTPLVVIIHLTQYIDYLEVTGRNVSECYQTTDVKVKAIGFCTGLLASSAISSSANEDEFRRHGAVAVRLAFCIGAIVDAHEQGAEGPSQSLAVTWESIAEEAATASLIDQFPSVGSLFRRILQNAGLTLLRLTLQ